MREGPLVKTCEAPRHQLEPLAALRVPIDRPARGERRQHDGRRRVHHDSRRSEQPGCCCARRLGGTAVVR